MLTSLFVVRKTNGPLDYFEEKMYNRGGSDLPWFGWWLLCHTPCWRMGYGELSAVAEKLSATAYLHYSIVLQFVKHKSLRLQRKYFLTQIVVDRHPAR